MDASRPTFVAAFACIVPLLSAPPVAACTCLPPSPQDGLAHSDAVLMVRVLSNEDAGSARLARVQIVKSWKSDGGDLTRVASSSSASACGVFLEPGGTYILFATREADGRSHLLEARACAVLRIDPETKCHDADQHCQRWRRDIEDVISYLDSNAEGTGDS